MDMEEEGSPIYFDPSDLFASIRQTQNSKLENQKNAHTLLQAVESTFAERGLERTAKNYFEALWPILDQAKQMPGMLGTVIYLCSFVFPALENAFIIEAYGEIYARFPVVIKECLADGPLIRSILVCLKKVFRAFPGEGQWEERLSLQELFALVLNLCQDERPKVRRLAQDCVASTSSGSRFALGLAVQLVKMTLQASTRKDSSRALHLVPLLAKLTPGLDQSAIDGLLGPVLQCVSLGNTHLSIGLLGFLEGLCRTVGEEDEEVAPSRAVQLNFSQTKKIVDGLLRLKPGTWELSDLSAAWIKAFGSALSHPANGNGRLNVSEHARLLLGALESESEAVHLAVQVAFSTLTCDVGLDQLLLETLQKGTGPERLGLVPYLLAIIRDQIMLRSPLPSGTTLTSTHAAILVELAALYDRKGFAGCRGDVTKAIGDYVRVFGSFAVLEALPLGLESAGCNRAWLLPVLKEAISNDSLGYFCQKILPLADRLKAKAAGHREAGKLGDAKVYETVVFQIWSLVPSYLKYPVDFIQAFPAFAPRLAAAITEDPILRPSLVNALATFIQLARQYEDDATSGSLILLRKISLEQNEAGLALIQEMIPNLLPVVFNLLGVTNADQRAYLLNCIRALLDVAPAGLVQDYFARVSRHLQASEEQRAAMFELLCTMLPFLEAGAYEQVLDMALPLLAAAEDPALQKALYKSMHYVLSHEIYGPVLFHARIAPLEQALLASGPLTEISAVRKCRFRLLLSLLPSLPDDHLAWIPALLPEVVLGTKEVNQKTRLLAFELLLAFGRRMSLGGLIQAGDLSGLPMDTPASLDEFITMVLAGLAGKTPHMISATVVSLARLLFDLAASLPAGTIQALLGDILLLFGSPSREIVKAAFGFVKVAIVALPPGALEPHLPQLVTSILAWSHEHALHFKVRVRHLIERLVRRFGYDQVAQFIPEEHRRLIVNIRKRKERLRRKKAAASIDDADAGLNEYDEIDLDAVTQAAYSRQTSMVTQRGISSSAQATRPSAKFEAALYDSESDLEDDDDDEVMEIMDAAPANDDDLETALSRKLSIRTMASRKTAMTAKPTAKQQQAKQPLKRSDDFKTNKEGKMIILDSEDEQEDDDAIVVDESAHKLYEQSLDTFQRPGKHFKFSQKRKRTDADSEDESGDDAAPAMSTAQSRMSRLSKVASRRPTTAFKHSGQEFRAKAGARGDVKSKKSKFEPYAYVPLQRAAKGSDPSSYYMKKASKK